MLQPHWRRFAATRARWAVPAAALLGLAAVIPGATATAQPVTPIQHVVVIYLENHSFDNLLGYWCDGNTGRCPDGGMPASVTLAGGTVVTPTTDPDTVPNINHNGNAQVTAMDNGKMDGWAKIPLAGRSGCSARTKYQCISGYQPSQIPNITSLASQFAISDMTFTESDSPSWEGHIDVVAANSDGFWGNNPSPAQGVTPGPGWGCDSDQVTQWAPPGGTYRNVPSCIPDWSLGLPNGGAFERTPVASIPTIMDRLDAAGLPWKIYGATTGEQAYGEWDICPTFAGCLDTSQDANLVDDSQFASDAASGNLPAFSVVTPGGTEFVDSCHNAESITACDNWVGQLMGDVESSPDWPTTAVFITWDDFGGFYDQVYPGTNASPDGTQEGPRVPMIIVSPFAKPGFTDTTPATFASILAYTEHTFGLSPLGPNDAYAYDFSNAFDYTQVPVKQITMVHRPLPWTARHIRLTPALLHDPS
jgi:phospholipase C